MNKGWLDFVVQNRSGNKRVEIDYIKEATGDDRLFAVAEQYESNLLDADTAVKAMNAMKIGDRCRLLGRKELLPETISDYGVAEMVQNAVFRQNFRGFLSGRTVSGVSEINQLAY